MAETILSDAVGLIMVVGMVSVAVMVIVLRYQRVPAAEVGRLLGAFVALVLVGALVAWLAVPRTAARPAPLEPSLPGPRLPVQPPAVDSVFKPVDSMPLERHQKRSDEYVKAALNRAEKEN